jgi:hypothetical protein
MGHPFRVGVSGKAEPQDTYCHSLWVGKISEGPHQKLCPILKKKLK